MKLKEFQGPMIDLPPQENVVRKFSNNCRLWVGNLPLDCTEEEIKDLFKPYGEMDEVYFDKNKGFAFIKLVCGKLINEIPFLQLNLLFLHS